MFHALKFLCLPTFVLAVLVSQAQGVEMLFGPRDGADGPVKVVANEVVFNQQDGVVEFVGDVSVTQGDIILKSDRAEAFSNKDDASKIDLILVSSGVYLETGQGTASANSGEYDLIEGIIKLVGEVTIRAGEVEFSAGGLHYDVKSGLSRLIDNASALVKGEN